MTDGEVDVIIEPDGRVRFIHDDDLAAVFSGEDVITRRASHVEPASAYGIAQTGWVADLSPLGDGVLVESGMLYGGPKFDFIEYPDPAVVAFPTRAAALAAEIAWIRERMAAGEAEFGQLDERSKRWR